MTNNTLTLEEFAGLLDEEELQPETLALIKTILTEIRTQASGFRASTYELVQLAQYSPTYLALPAGPQEFLASIMSMPVFFITWPDDDKTEECK